ncbi:MAG: oxidoreductase [Bacteroidetes bacterium]|nr:oxidoreductase [Fibrella sp.]
MTPNRSKTALLIGATGLIGDLLARRLVESPAYERVKVLVRRSLSWQHPRLQEILIDFDHTNGLLVQGDDIFCCLGTTMKQAGSQAAFRRVDYQYPLEIARLGLSKGASQFALVSSMGADPKSSFFYNRVKGEVERDLASLAYPTLLTFRPSILLGDRSESRLGERISTGVMRLFGPILPARYRPIPATKVADAMLETAQQGLLGKHIFESDALQDF